jgi:serine protease Do
MAEAQGLGDQKGAIVADISAGGPSARAGLQVGDVVTAVNGSAIKSSSELTRQVARVRAGDVLHLNVIRDGKARTVDIKSGARPSERELAANDNGQGPPGSRNPSGPGVLVKAPPVLGMSLGALDDTTRNRLSLPEGVRGALVEGVDQSSDAGTKGLRRGDVITLANGRALSAPADFAAVVDAAKKAGRSSVLVGVWRNGRTNFLPLKVSG